MKTRLIRRLSILFKETIHDNLIMNVENAVIRQFFQGLTRNQLDLDFVNYVENDFPNSYVLQFYLGMYRKGNNQITKADKHFTKAISLNPLFVPPYFELSTVSESMLERVWNCKTLNGTTGKMEYQLESQLRIGSMLAKMGSKPRKRYETLISKMETEFNNENLVHWQCWKTMCFSLAELNEEPESRIKLFEKGLSKWFPYSDDLIMVTGSIERKIRDMDRELIQNIMLTRFFCQKPVTISVSIPNFNHCFSLWQNNAFREWNCRNVRNCGGSVRCSNSYNQGNDKQDNKIRIGYLSPDFNNNAVGLFLTPLLKYFDKDRFEIVCYDNSEHADTYQQLYWNRFHEYPGIEWKPVRQINDFALANLIYDDNIDILVDLIGFGVRNRIETVIMKPAPIILNYLGYPGFTGFETHRLVDVYTEFCGEETKRDSIELDTKLVKMSSRPFCCYHLFDVHEELPSIVPRNESKTIRIGIFNRSNKYSKFTMTCWKLILKRFPNIEFWVKLDFLEREKHKMKFKELPASRIRFFDFQESLPEYLNLFNQVDVCLDTFPYSGTTTTCSALLMGVPTINIYNPETNQHVSNVTGALMKWIGLGDEFNCKTSNELIKRIEEFKPKDKMEIRNRFLKTMDPKAFMEEYETVLTSLTTKK